MGKEILNKLDSFINETITVNDFPKQQQYNLQQEKYSGEKVIQFLRFWEIFRPGDTVNVSFEDDSIYLYAASKGGNFAGIEKEMVLDDPNDMMMFKTAEGRDWNFV